MKAAAVDCAVSPYIYFTLISTIKISPVGLKIKPYRGFPTLSIPSPMDRVGKSPVNGLIQLFVGLVYVYFNMFLAGCQEYFYIIIWYEPPYSEASPKAPDFVTISHENH